MNISDIAYRAKTLAAYARELGFVVTIEQQSTQPPAMGQHVDVVSVRERRRTAEVIRRCAGPNCESINGSEHSPECVLQHEAASIGSSESRARKPWHGGRVDG